MFQTGVDVLIQELIDDAEVRKAEAQLHMYKIHDRNIVQEPSPWLRRTNGMSRFNGKDMKPKRDPQNRNDERLRLIWDSIAVTD